MKLTDTAGRLAGMILTTDDADTVAAVADLEHALATIERIVGDWALIPGMTLRARRHDPIGPMVLTDQTYFTVSRDIRFR